MIFDRTPQLTRSALGFSYILLNGVPEPCEFFPVLLVQFNADVPFEAFEVPVDGMKDVLAGIMVGIAGSAGTVKSSGR